MMSKRDEFVQPRSTSFGTVDSATHTGELFDALKIVSNPVYLQIPGFLLYANQTLHILQDQINCSPSQLT